jgi:phospholipid/cholesterol/gamma-HCH transport system substrate-binding protein
MKEQIAETILGGLVALVAIAFFVFASTQAGQGEAKGGGYQLWGRFQRVDGISVGSDVRVSGVKVGVVRDVRLDPETWYARLTFDIDRNVQVLDQSTARVQSDGLLGGAYIAIEPAGMDPLAPNSEIPNTQGSVDLLTLLASAAQSMGQRSDEGEQKQEAAP